MSRLRKAAWATLISQVFNWAGLLLSLVAVPLYLHWLGQERYGLLLTGMAFGSYLMFADAGLSWAAMLLISQAHGRDDKDDISAIVRSGVSLAALSTFVVMTVVVTVFLALRDPQRPSWLPAHGEAAGLVLSIGLSVVVSLCLSPAYGLFMGLQEMHLAALYQGVARLAGIMASVAAAAMEAPLGVVFGANVACALLAGGMAAIHCVRRHPWAFQRGSFWDRQQIRRQLRTGGKSLATQVGNVLSGTAPVLAISLFAGAACVPFFSVPLTLLNAPLSLMNSLSATLQPGYGEAIGRDERAWIAETIRSILSLGLVFMGLLIAGFIVLAGPFVQLWTDGRLEIPPLMLLSVVCIGGTGALVGIFRFALTGMNRHRIAGFSELGCGVLSLAACALTVYAGGFASVGLGSLVAVATTSGWILPAQLKQTLSENKPWIQMRLILKVLMVVVISIGVGHEFLQLMAPTGPALAIFITGLLIVACYLSFIRFTCPGLWAKAIKLIRGKATPQRS